MSEQKIMAKKDGEPERAIAYIRVSSEGQATGDKVSLQEQSKALRKLAERKGYALEDPPGDLREHLHRNLSPEVLPEIAGCWGDVFSGEALEKRRGIMAVLARVKEGGIERVLVYEDSRLARDELVAQLIARDLAAAKCKLETLSTVYDFADDTHRTMFGYQAVGQASWKRQMAAALKRGKKGCADRGRWACATVTYGWTWNRELKAPALDAERAAVVAEVFRLSAQEQMACEHIAGLLNARGIPSPGKACKGAKDGQRWHAFQVSRLLREPRYKGDRWETAPGIAVAPAHAPCRILTDLDGKPQRDTQDRLITEPAPALVSVETWETAQRTVELHRRNGGGPWVGRRYLLSGMVRCGICRGAMMAMEAKSRSGKEYSYYACCRARKTRHTECEQKSMPAADVDGSVWRYILELAAKPGLIAEAARHTKEAHFEEWRAELKQVYSELKGLKMREGRARVAYERDSYTLEEYEASKADIAEQRAALELRQARLEAMAEHEGEVQAGVSDTAEALKAAGDLDKLDQAGRRRLLTKIHVRVIVQDRGHFRLQWYGGKAAQKVRVDSHTRKCVWIRRGVT